MTGSGSTRTGKAIGLGKKMVQTESLTAYAYTHMFGKSITVPSQTGMTSIILTTIHQTMTFQISLQSRHLNTTNCIWLNVINWN